MWHRKGGLVVTTDQPGTRVDEQNWSMLTLEAFPHSASTVQLSQQHTLAGGAAAVGVTKAHATHRHVYSLGTGAHTDVLMTTTIKCVDEKPGNASSKSVRFDIGASDDGTNRAWSVRLHLSPGEQLVRASVDGALISRGELPALHLQPVPAALAGTFAPFGGTGTRPAPLAGPVAQVRVSAGPGARVVELQVKFGTV